MTGITAAIVVLSGGIKKISDFCRKIIPPMAAVYIIACLCIIFANIGQVPAAFGMIFKYVFHSVLAIGRGASCGNISNETGMGTAMPVHSTAQTDRPAHYVMYSILEVFIEAIIVPNMNALVMLSTKFFKLYREYIGRLKNAKPQKTEEK